MSDIRKQLDRWWATADLDARAGEPVGKALREATGTVERLHAEIDRLKRTIARGRVLHQAIGPHCPICDKNDVNNPACTHCSRYCGTCKRGDWPCPTRAALDQPADQEGTGT